jgi:hypothetical protein
MGHVIRDFFIDQNDDLYRLPNKTFQQMLRKSSSHRIPRFAAARVRKAAIIVELLDRQPVGIIWRTFNILTFDDKGSMDSAAFDRYERAIAEVVLNPVLRSRLPSDVAPTLVNAANRFVVQGGRWLPSRTLMRRIDDAALGQVKCPRL